MRPSFLSTPDSFFPTNHPPLQLASELFPAHVWYYIIFINFDIYKIYMSIFYSTLSSDWYIIKVLSSTSLNKISFFSIIFSNMCFVVYLPLHTFFPGVSLSTGDSSHCQRNRMADEMKSFKMPSYTSTSFLCQDNKVFLVHRKQCFFLLPRHQSVSCA